MKAVQEKTKASVLARIYVSGRTKKSYFHWHNKCEVCKIIKGTTDFLIDGKIVKASVGDIVFMNEGAFHQFIFSEQKPEMRLMQFTNEAITEGKTAFTPIKTHITHEEIASVPHLEETVDFLWDTIIRETEEINCVYDNPFVKSVAQAFYHLLVRHFPDNDTGVKKDKIKFQEVIDYIKNHYTEELTAGELAKEMYMSRTTLSNLFSRYAGTGINEYINTLRVSSVNNLLLQGKSITDAAMESGFRSVRTFNHVYKKYTGITPTEYVETIVNKL